MAWCLESNASTATKSPQLRLPLDPFTRMVSLGFSMSDFDYANFAAGLSAKNNGITERAQNAFRARVFMVALWAEAMNAVAQIRHATPGSPLELDEVGGTCDGLAIRRDLVRCVYLERVGDRVRLWTAGLYPGLNYYIDLPHHGPDDVRATATREVRAAIGALLSPAS